jgi:hypothetical protein
MNKWIQHDLKRIDETKWRYKKSSYSPQDNSNREEYQLNEHR